MDTTIKLSICIPVYNMPNGDYFLQRAVDSIKSQTFTDYEIVITKEGTMAVNTNAAIKKAKGEIIKILYQDDYLAYKDSLQVIVDAFRGGWLATGCLHDNGIELFNPHYPSYNEKISTGLNTIGSPSVVAFENNNPLLFDEELTWLLDCDLYHRLYARYGEPTLSNDLNVVIGVGDHQATNIMGDQIKLQEYQYIYEKHTSL